MERTFGEARRRTKVIPRFPTEGSCLSLVFGVLVRASQKRRGVRMGPKILRQLDELRAQRQKTRPGVAEGKIARPRSSWRVAEMPSVRDSEMMHSNGELLGVR